MRNRSNTITIDTRKSAQCIIALLFLVGLTIPEGVFYITPFLGSLWKYYRWIVLFIIIISFFVTRNNYVVVQKSSLLQCAFFGYLFLITMFKGASLHECISTYLPLVCTALLVVLFRHNIDVLIDSTFLYLFILAIINLYCVISYPNGMYKSLSVLGYTKNWMMGYKSSFQFYLYPLFIVSILNIKYKRIVLFSTISLFIILLQTLLAGNIMLVGVCFFSAIVAFSPIRKIKPIYNPWFIVVSFAFINIVVVTFGFLNIKILYNLITDVFHKSITLSGREAIWNTTLRQIQNHLLFGHGKVLAHERQAYLRGLSHSHNQFLECLYQGGIIGTLIFCTVLISSLRETYYKIQMKSSVILGISLIGILMMGTVEITMHQNDCFMWMLISLCNYTEEIEYAFTYLHFEGRKIENVY